ncbi:MAG: N-acetyltransferase [Chloroflexi bacterium]|nr:N-acetyltransferase [Chloroflexota bacterium]
MSDFYVHESSILDPGVRVGKGTRIWHFCHIMSGAEIGEDCNLGQNTFVGRNVKIGNKCKIQNNVSVYEGVTLEDGVFCGPSCVFTNDLNPRALYPKQGDYVPTLVRHGASIGANVTIVCGVTIGRWAFIGAGAVVTNDVPDYALVYGVPAQLRGWVCECGVKLEFKGSEAVCTACERSYVLSPHGTVEEKRTQG